MTSAVQIVVIAAVVILVIARRFAGSPVGSRTLVLPLILTAFGVSQLVENHLSWSAIGLLVAEGVVALAAGAGRAMTVKLYEKDGHLWQRYTPLTVAVWLGLIAVRLSVLVVGAHIGMDVPAGGSIMAVLGLSFVVEVLLVNRRAAASGVPVMSREQIRAMSRG
jgi:hypothetical protein